MDRRNYVVSGTARRKEQIQEAFPNMLLRDYADRVEDRISTLADDKKCHPPAYNSGTRFYAITCFSSSGAFHSIPNESTNGHRMVRIIAFITYKEANTILLQTITHGPAIQKAFLLLPNTPPVRTDPKHGECLLQQLLRLSRVAKQDETWHVSRFLH